MYAEGIEPTSYAMAAITTAVPTVSIRAPSVAERSPGARPTRETYLSRAGRPRATLSSVLKSNSSATS